MDKGQIKQTGWRGSADLWLDAGLRALVEGGVEAVRIQPLAQQLKLSRTSFYWFFKDREALLAALLDRWEARNTAALAAAAGAYAATPAEAMLNVIGCFLDPAAFDPKLEFAVRGWALQSQVAADRVEVADAARLQALTAMLEHHGYCADEADVRARTIYLVQIGYISMQSRETLETRLQRVPGYVRIYAGQAPSEADTARFRARFEQL